MEISKVLTLYGGVEMRSKGVRISVDGSCILSNPKIPTVPNFSGLSRYQAPCPEVPKYNKLVPN